MRIGIDIDNTITRTSETILEYARAFGYENGLNSVPDRRAYFLEEALGWSKEMVARFFERSLLDIYTNMRPQPMALETIHEWSSRHYLVLITSRNKFSPGIEQVTREWLTRNRVVYHKLIMNTTSNMHYSSKVAACQESQVDIMIEDHHDLALELSVVLPVILVTHPYNEHLKAPNIIRVNDWCEIKKIVQSLEENQQARQGKDFWLPGDLPGRSEEG